MIEEKVNEEVIDLKIRHKKEFRTIEGIKTSPLSKADKNPTVILVHGFGANKHEYGLFDEIVQVLAKEGILSYRFDLLEKGEKDNEYIEPPLSTQRMYLKYILNYVKNQPETDDFKIGVLGQSLGSLVTMITANDKIIKREKQLKTLALMGAASNIKNTLINYIGSKHVKYTPNEPIIVEKSDERKIIINPNFWKDLMQYTPTNEIRKCDYCSLLLVRGAKDGIISEKEIKKLYSESLKSKNEKWRITIENADHGFNPNRTGLYIALREWFKKKLV